MANRKIIIYARELKKAEFAQENGEAFFYEFPEQYTADSTSFNEAPWGVHGIFNGKTTRIPWSRIDKIIEEPGS